MIDLNMISQSCVKCGRCIPVCTIHDINRDETTSPRGFLDLIGAYKSGDLKLDRNLKNIFESCFLCTNCVEVCPKNLRVDTAIETLRQDIALKFGMPWYKRLAFWLLGHRSILDILAKLGYVFQSCGFKILKDSGFNDNMKPRFSLPLIKKERLLPSASKKSFLNSHSEFIDNGGSKTIGIFIGCMGNYAYTNIGESLLKICKALKLNVDLMKKQACCGAPAYFTGELNSVKKGALVNLKYFEEKLKFLDAIIIPEATCSAMIKIDYFHVFDRQEDRDRLKEVNKKIFMATEYFDKFTDLRNLLAKKGKNNIIVTYHDPCHAKKMQGIFIEPRKLLGMNFSIFEMENSNKCCGFGGVTMQTEKYNLSSKSGLIKANMIEKTDAKFVAAECSACKMQISNSLHIKNSQIKCVNPIELIAMNL